MVLIDKTCLPGHVAIEQGTTLETIGTLIAFVALVAFVLGTIGLFRPIMWARIQSRKQAAIVMGVSFIAFMIGGAFLPAAEKDDSALDATTTTTEFPVEADQTTLAQTTQTATATTSPAPATSNPPPTTSARTTTTPAATVTKYEILDEEDISFGRAIRYNLRVTVEAGSTREDLRQVAAEISELYRVSRQYSALNIFFYHYPEVSNDIATLGVWDDSPYGDWGRADEVEPGDYSTHEPNDQTKEKDWSLLPSEKDATLYAAYNALFYVLAESSDEYPSDDDVIALVAEQEGASAEDVEGAIDRFLDWVFNDQS